MILNQHKRLSVKKDWSKSDTTSISFLVELNNVRINRVQCHLTGSKQYKNYF